MKHSRSIPIVYEVASAREFLQKNTKIFGDFLEEHQSQISEIKRLDANAKESYKKNVASALMGLEYDPPAGEIAHQMIYGTIETCQDSYDKYLKDSSKKMEQEAMKKIASNVESYKNDATDFLEGEKIDPPASVAKYFFTMDQLGCEPTTFTDHTIEYNINEILESMAESKGDDKEVMRVEESGAKPDIEQFFADTLTKLTPWLEKKMGNHI